MMIEIQGSGEHEGQTYIRNINTISLFRDRKLNIASVLFHDNTGDYVNISQEEFIRIQKLLMERQ